MTDSRRRMEILRHVTDAMTASPALSSGDRHDALNELRNLLFAPSSIANVAPPKSATWFDGSRSTK